MERSRRLVNLALQGLDPSTSSSSSSMSKEYSIVKILRHGLFKIVPSDQVCITHTEGLHMTTHNGKDSWCIIFKQGGLREMQTELEVLNRFNDLESRYKFMEFPSVETQTDVSNLSDKDTQTDEIPIPLLDLPVELLNPIGELQSVETHGQMYGTYNIVPFCGNDQLSLHQPDDISVSVPVEQVETYSFPLTPVHGAELTGGDINSGEIDAEELEVAAVSEIRVPAGDMPAGDMPAGDMPAGDMPAGDMQAGDMPAGDMPAGDMPAGDMPAGDMPAGDMPAGDMPAGDMQAGDMPAGDMPAGDMPTGDMPVEDMQAGDMPAGDMQAGDMPAGDMPAGDMPTGDMPVEDMPAQEDLPFQMSGVKNKKNRPQFCIYCKKRIFNLPRHLLLVHDDQDLVKEYMSLRDSGNKKMYEVVAQLRRKGNAEYNKLLKEKGLPVEGVRVTKDDSQLLLKSCPNCGAFYKKKTLYRHFKSCSGKPAEKNFASIVEGKDKLSKASLTVSMCPELREQIIPGMRIGHNDDVVDTIINDEDLISMGNNLVMKFGHELDTQKKLIRRRLRAMAHLKITMEKEDPTIQKVRDIFDTEKWETYLKAVQEIAKLKSDEQDIAPNVVNELGLLATNVARNVRVSLPKTPTGEAYKTSIEDWLKKHEVQFGTTIGYQARKLAERKKWKKTKYEPVAEDITLLNNHLKETIKKALETLQTEFDKNHWEELNKACMLLLLIFNRKRVGELENMKVSDFERKQKVRKDTDVYQTLTESEKMLASNFYHVQIRGKLARGVPILIEEGLANAIGVLVSYREEAGIPETNQFLFAKADGHLDGSQTLSYAAMTCGAKNPKSLTSTRLRKHIASVSQALNLTDSDLKTLSGFLGHTTKTHLENYRLPSDAVHAAKLSKLLLALDQGTISKFKGKSMEEIDVSTSVAEVEEEVGIVDVEPIENIRQVTLKKNKTTLVTTPSKRKTPRGHMRPSPSPIKSPKTSHCSPSQPQRRKWTPEEVAAMETEFSEFLKDERLPGTTFCNEVRKRCDILSTRKAALIRAWINNQIVKRKKVQRKRLFTSD